jgi:lipoprotein-anchoring transpeptidase ErfK/SrfK
MAKHLASFWFIGSALVILPQLATADPAGTPGSYGGGFLELLLTGGIAPPSTTQDPWQPIAPPAPGAPQDMGQPAAAPPPMQASIPPSAYSAEGEPSDAQHGINPIFQRQEVDYKGPEKPGTIVIDTPNKFLFLVEKGGHALRYGIGVGRPDFAWSGVKAISRKAEWPDWTPPPEMLKRRPDLPTFMAGGPDNPLGARALYLGFSLYRIHGTNEPYTIGTNVSSGCIRMMNDDVIDLYGRVRVGTKVIVM